MTPGHQAPHVPKHRKMISDMTSRLPRTAQSRRRVVIAVPLVLVSAAWTVHVAGNGAVPTGAATAVPDAPAGPSDGFSGAGESVRPPASVSPRGTVVTAGDNGFTRAVGTASAGDIPSSALAAYQRAETVINAADPACGLSWQLIAAIGRVESDHGRFGGSVVDTSGLAMPAITGPVLDGSNGTSLIRDTDAGEYDGDLRFDRAVGPMQFIPSTWAVVGVDADNDGVRNPQDIDDAALGTAVYLCSADDDLTTDAGLRAAVYRYNHSSSYVDLVLSTMDKYLDGDYDASPDPVVSARYADPEPLTPLDNGANDDFRPTVEADDEPAVEVDEPDDALAPVETGTPPAEGNGNAPAPGGTTPPVGDDDIDQPTEPTEPEPTEPEPTEPEPTEPEPTEPEPTYPARRAPARLDGLRGR